MDANTLTVTEQALEDNSIVNTKKHTHQRYSTTTFNNNDEIRIPIQQQDSFTLPWNSLIYIEGRLSKDDGSVDENAFLVNNAILHLFEEIRYELNGIIVDRVRNPGITTTLKSFVSYNKNESTALMIAGWYPGHSKSSILNSKGYFNVCIPLRMVLGFAEDFRKIIMNLRQELVLVRSNTNSNAFLTADDSSKLKLELTKIEWKIPHISVADVERLMLLNLIQKNVELDIPFRSWELMEYPALQQTQRHTWTVKASSQLEKPRFIIFGFQTNRKNHDLLSSSEFDHCNLTNIKLYLNSEMYPYDNLNLNFDKNCFATLYDMYAHFQSSYYGRPNEPVLTAAEFLKYAPIVVIDCTHENEILKTGAVDIRLEFETSTNVPDKTAAYCLILHDKIVKYSPASSIVRVL